MLSPVLRIVSCLSKREPVADEDFVTYCDF